MNDVMIKEASPDDAENLIAYMKKNWWGVG